MNNQTQEALKMAIEYLEAQGYSIERQAVLDACKEALATNEKSSEVQPAQGIELEWYNKGWTDANFEWQGLTDDEIETIDADCWVFPEDESELFNHYNFARAIEQALRERNTP